MYKFWTPRNYRHNVITEIYISTKQRYNFQFKKAYELKFE